VVGVFAHDSIDDDPVRDQALGDDPHGSGAIATPCSSHALQARFSRLVTSTKLLGRLHVQYFADFVAITFVPARSFRIHTVPKCRRSTRSRGEIGGQRLAARMLASLLVFLRGGQRVAITLGGTFNVADAGFELQQLQLQIAKLSLPGRTWRSSASEDALQEPGSSAWHIEVRSTLCRAAFHNRQSRRSRLQTATQEAALQLFEKVGGETRTVARCGHRSRLGSLTHDVYS